MLRREDLPHHVNLASHFVDRNVAEGRGGRAAVITDAGFTTYASLAKLVNRAGHVLLSLGVRRGDRVLLALSDGVPFVAAWYGAQKIGAVTAEVYTFLPAKDHAYALGYTGAKVVLVDAVTVDAVRAAATGQQLLVVGSDVELRPGEHSFDALVAQASDELEAAPTGRDDVAIWKFTTGSTGAPKACVHPVHSPLLSADWYARGVLGLQAGDVVLPVPKLFFGYARDLTALYPFGVGGAGIVFPERSTPDRLFELIATHRPTILVNVPTMMAAMVAHVHQDGGSQDLSCLRLCTSAGEALPAELAQRWHDTFGIEVIDGIGSSEAYHIYISTRPGEPRPGSLGRVVPGYTARVTDDDGLDLPDGETGILEITGDTVALEYFDAPEKSATTFIGNRTVRSGDLFLRDAEGFYYYRGRVDDLLKVGGVWVAPAEIENCVLTHPSVVECAVVGYTENGLVKPRAFVVLAPGASVDAAAIQQLVRTRLSPHKYPRDVRFVDTLPRTANGKLDRRALRDPRTDDPVSDAGADGPTNPAGPAHSGSDAAGGSRGPTGSAAADPATTDAGLVDPTGPGDPRSDAGAGGPA